MQDALKLLTGYFLKEMEAKEPPYVVRIPRRFLEYMVEFYLKAYLNDPVLKLEGNKMVIEGVNFVKIKAEITLKPGDWSDEHKEILIGLKLNRVLMPFVKSFISPFEVKFKDVVKYRDNFVVIDIEQAIQKSQIVDSCTKPLRRRIKLQDIKITSDSIELYFNKN